MHDAQFGEYGSPSTMVIMVGRTPPPPHGKEDILKAMGIRVKPSSDSDSASTMVTIVNGLPYSSNYA